MIRSSVGDIGESTGRFHSGSQFLKVFEHLHKFDTTGDLNLALGTGDRGDDRINPGIFVRDTKLREKGDIVQLLN